MKSKVCFKFLYVKKIVAAFIITIIIGVLLSGFFVEIYKPFISAAAIGKANSLIQNLSNQTVLEIIKTNKFESFVDIIKGSEDKISGIKTDTIKINEFKSMFLNKMALNLDKMQNQKFGIPVLAFLNNPFLSEIGPVVYIKLRPVGIINADINSAFLTAGVNQTKHQIDLIFNIKVTIVMPAIQIEHVVTSTVPIAQTVIVGEVPQSYTNVTTTSDKLDDTVLQLAEN